MLLRANLNGEIKEIDLSFGVTYSLRDIGQKIGFFDKEQLEEISSLLKIPLIIE